MAKDFLQENNVSFEEKDVARDVKAREEMIEKSGQLGVPVIVVGNEVIVGFDRDTLKRILKL